MQTRKQMFITLLRNRKLKTNNKRKINNNSPAGTCVVLCRRNNPLIRRVLPLNYEERDNSERHIFPFMITYSEYNEFIQIGTQV